MIEENILVVFNNFHEKCFCWCWVNAEGKCSYLLYRSSTVVVDSSHRFTVMNINEMNVSDQ